MILLDTNVVSEDMKVAPATAVLEWLNQQESRFLFLSAITIGEIEHGLRILPVGKRRLDLSERFEKFISKAFAERVLAYDDAAARIYGDVMGLRKEQGRPMSVPDGQIAAIARSGDMAIATRNTSDFEECGVDVVNPFRADK